MSKANTDHEYMTIMKNLIRVERARYNLSQQDLADKLGITRQSVYAIESGKFIPSTLLALKMAKLFNIKVEDIFELEDTDYTDK